MVALFKLPVLAFLAISTATAAFAVELKEQHNSNAVWFENWVGLTNGTLKVTSPEGLVTEIFAATGTPVFELSGRDVLDGIYRYELNAATEEQVKIVNKIDNGRGENASDTQAKPFYHSGHFVVQRGVIIEQEEVKEEQEG